MMLALITGLLLPLVALATLILTPFSDRKTQGVLLTTYFVYVGTTHQLAGMLA